jgi:hypothetical protein
VFGLAKPNYSLARSASGYLELSPVATVENLQAARPLASDYHLSVMIAEFDLSNRSASGVNLATGQSSHEYECTAAPGTGIDSRSARFERRSVADRSRAQACFPSSITTATTMPVACVIQCESHTKRYAHTNERSNERITTRSGVDDSGRKSSANRLIYARDLTTTLTTKAVNTGGQCTSRWTEYCTGLLSADAGGQLSSGLSRR